jgi:hypothetical protein
MADREDTGAPSRGKLTSRLTSAESMAKGLEDLLAGVLRYTVLIRRPSFSWDSGQFQSTYLALYEGENNKLVVDGKIDPKLLKSRQVVLLATASDGGTAKIHLTSRRIEVLARTPDLDKLLKSFNAQLLDGAKSRWLTIGGCWALAILPGIFIGSLFIIDSLVNPRIRHAFYGNNGSTKVASSGPPPDKWTIHAALALLPFWLAAVVLAIVVGLVVVRSGPLRIWPRSLSLKSLLHAMYQIRVSGALTRNLLFIIVSIISAVIGGVVTALVSK